MYVAAQGSGLCFWWLHCLVAVCLVASRLGVSNYAVSMLVAGVFLACLLGMAGCLLHRP